MKKVTENNLHAAFAMAAYNMLARKANRENLSDEEFEKLVEDFLRSMQQKIAQHAAENIKEKVDGI